MNSVDVFEEEEDSDEGSENDVSMSRSRSRIFKQFARGDEQKLSSYSKYSKSNKLEKKNTIKRLNSQAIYRFESLNADDSDFNDGSIESSKEKSKKSKK